MRIAVTAMCRELFAGDGTREIHQNYGRRCLDESASSRRDHTSGSQHTDFGKATAGENNGLDGSGGRSRYREEHVAGTRLEWDGMEGARLMQTFQ
jgi:hypothetical protein